LRRTRNTSQNQLDKILSLVYHKNRVNTSLHSERQHLAGVFAFVDHDRGPNSFIRNTYQETRLCTILVQLKSRRINTCEGAAKQMTLTVFRMNTYAKPRGKGIVKQASHTTKPLEQFSGTSIGFAPTELRRLSRLLRSAHDRESGPRKFTIGGTANETRCNLR
jgi:hypothetical protein